jgi:hypothetical protein
VDKTKFIEEWWESQDEVTLITRPRRFGKTLNMSMVEQFFSTKYASRGDLFQGLAIWEKEKYQELQGTYPVISLSFANVKERNYETTVQRMNQILTEVYYDVSFTRSLFNSTFKTNPYLERAIMTGITRVSRESIFSDLNNLEVVTTTSEKYAERFGFTENEVFAALDEFGMSDQKQKIKNWYDGFTFGKQTDIYNPWSVLNYLDKRKAATYWANSSSNSLVGKLIQEGDKEIKQKLECLMQGGKIRVEIDEQIVYGELHTKRNSIWSLLLASGYLKVVQMEFMEETSRWYHTLTLTNREVRLMFGNMIRGWFAKQDSSYNDFIKALLLGDLDAMNDYMNHVSQSVYGCFDSGKGSSGSQPERFYHGFVLGMLMELEGRYQLTSNRESGFGRYDVMLEPLKPEDPAIILEFKVFQPRREKELSDTVQAALKQIEEKQYETTLLNRGIRRSRIRKYGFAFEGQRVLIGEA